MEWSKSKIDALGVRLRRGTYIEEDLRALEDYRGSFEAAYRLTVSRIEDALGVRPSGRPRKTTEAIVDKLHRQSIRLSQMQDIAGCRIVLSGLGEQDARVRELANIFGCTPFDRRAAPSNGYRAVHLIVWSERRCVEIQVRTVLQHLWAELCEKCSEGLEDKALKYGGGPPEAREMLARASDLAYEVDMRSAREGMSGRPSTEHPLWRKTAETLVAMIEKWGG